MPWPRHAEQDRVQRGAGCCCAAQRGVWGMGGWRGGRRTAGGGGALQAGAAHCRRGRRTAGGGGALQAGAAVRGVALATPRHLWSTRLTAGAGGSHHAHLPRGQRHLQLLQVHRGHHQARGEPPVPLPPPACRARSAAFRPATRLRPPGGPPPPSARVGQSLGLISGDPALRCRSLLHSAHVGPPRLVPPPPGPAPGADQGGALPGGG